MHGGATGPLATGIDYFLIITYFGFIFVALACLLYYLLFLFVGSARLSWAVWLLYGALVLVFIGVFAAANPPTQARVTGLYGDAIFGPYQAIASALGLVFFAPLILAAIGLFFVVRRVHEPGQRYRLLLLSTSLTFYLLMPLLFNSNPGIEPADAGAWTREALNKVGLLVAVAAVFLAYRPPAWIARRLEARREGR